MENTEPAFPEGESLSTIADRARERLQNKRDSGQVRSWVERILRWKIEPFHLRSEAILEVARVLHEVIEEGYRKDPKGWKYLYKSISEWIKWC